MAIDLHNLKAFTFGREFKQLLNESLDRKLVEGAAFDLLPETLNEEDSAKANKAEYLNSIKQYESDFKDASKDSDPDIRERGKQALALVAKVKNLPEAKFANGVPRHYSVFMDSLFAYVCGLRSKLPTLKENIKTSMSDEYLAEIYDGFTPNEIEVFKEHVRSDAISIDWSKLDDEERDAVMHIKELGRQLGSDPGAYASGVLRLTFKNKKAASDYTDALEEIDFVDGYEIEVYRENLPDGFVEAEEYDFDNIMFDNGFEFNVFVYLIPEIVSEEPFEIDVEDDFEVDGENVEYISEVRRRIKINFRGRKKIKMQCRKGFRWIAAKKACVKITGSEVALKRKAMRRMVRTKKAKGASFKARVNRKTKKAKRFRRSMGVKSFSWSGLK